MNFIKVCATLTLTVLCGMHGVFGQTRTEKQTLKGEVLPNKFENIKPNFGKYIPQIPPEVSVNWQTSNTTVNWVEGKYLAWLIEKGFSNNLDPRIQNRTSANIKIRPYFNVGKIFNRNIWMYPGVKLPSRSPHPLIIRSGDYWSLKFQTVWRF